MPFIITQQVQPEVIIRVMQSQQAWIMAQQPLSPLVQVMHTPSLVISQRHIPIIRLQQQAIIPFIIMQHEHMPPASIVQRLCIIPMAILSSLVHIIFMPPSHFSIRTVHRGTIIMFIGVVMPEGPAIVPPAIPGAVPVIPNGPRSIIIAGFIINSRSRSCNLMNRSSPPDLTRPIILEYPLFSSTLALKSRNSMISN
jgi:hypothetical protein